MNDTPIGYEVLMRKSWHVLVRLRFAEPPWLAQLSGRHHPRARSTCNAWLEPGFTAAHRLLYLVTWFDFLARQGASDEDIRRWFETPQHVNADQVSTPWSALSDGAIAELAQLQVSLNCAAQLEGTCRAHGVM